MIKLKKRLSIIILFILAFVAVPKHVTAITSVGGYTIDAYDINMVVNENNTFNITETITTNFSGNNKHGIFRKIPIINTVEREDGSKSVNKATISNIEVSDTYVTSMEANCKVIKIGDANKTITGKKTYVIKYTYDIGRDPLEHADELYFNLIGNEWDTTIKNVTFTIKMPKSFDETKLGFSVGKYGASGGFKGEYNVKDNVISGSYEKMMAIGDSLTVRLTLPESYFVGENYAFNYIVLIEVVISIIFLVVSFVMWKRYGKNGKIVKTLEFYPPNNLNSAQLAYEYKGKCSKKQIISLLIYLADKGYLKIEEYKDSHGKSKCRFIKLKEYDGKNEAEEVFFNGLFREKDEVVSEADSLKNKFYSTISMVGRIIKSDGKEKIFEKAPKSKRRAMAIMPAIIYLFMMSQTWQFYDIKTVLSILTFTVMFFAIPLCVLYEHPKPSNAIANILLLTSSSLIFMVQVIVLDKMYLLLAIVGGISLTTILILLGLMERRTAYGIEVLGKIIGFKTFLKEAEKPKLEELVLENPEYFFNILPYTYVLGISKKWIKKFEKIGIEPPTWYASENGKDMHHFNRFIKHSSYSIYKDMTSSPRERTESYSGGGFSGGGFSGGGSGGGGGGSW